MRWRAAAFIAALVAVPAQAADRAALERVAERLRVAAAPWCHHLADIGADGVRRCMVPIRTLDLGDQHNAVAFLGNHTVTEAMLALLDEDELAHVLGHELAHTVLAHAVANLRKDPAAQRLLPLLEFSMPPPHQDVATTPHAQELDADALGLYLAGLAGYSVQAQERWWRRMPALLPEAWSQDGPSHPAATRRAAAAAVQAKRFCAQLAAGELLQPDAPRLHIAYENRADELRRQQARLDAAHVCPP